MDDRPSVVLLNPPSDRRLHRDYSCCTASKAGYLWHPIDLLVQSAYLGRRYRVTVMDAVASRETAPQVVSRVEALRPVAVFSLVGSLTLDADLALLDQIKQTCRARVVVGGDVALDGPDLLLRRAPAVDAVLTDFSRDALSAYVDGEAGPLEGLVARGQPATARRTRGEFAYPPPDPALFADPAYGMPHAPRPFASVLTTYGCPFRCAFCNSGVEGLGYRTRELENLFDELRGVRAAGLRHVFFKDMTFGVDAERTARICRFLREEGGGLTWHAYTRLDLLDADVLRRYGESGCRLLQVGLETTSPRAARFGKPHDDRRVREIIRLAAENGIAVGAHYVLGLPGDGLPDLLRTAVAARGYDTAYASFNVFVPRPGAALGRSDGASSGGVADRAAVLAAYLLYYSRPAALGRAVQAMQAGRPGLAAARSALALLGYALRSPDVVRTAGRQRRER